MTEFASIYTVAVIHTPDMKRVVTLLWILITIYKRVEIINVKYEQRGSILKKRREDLTIQYLVNSILDVTLSVAGTVISSLLLLSGDIEQNPGPGKTNCYIFMFTPNLLLICQSVGTCTDLDYASVDATQILSKCPHDVKTWLYININASFPQCV